MIHFKPGVHGGHVGERCSVLVRPCGLLPLRNTAKIEVGYRAIAKMGLVGVYEDRFG